MSKVAEEEDVKLEDILSSIRGIIDDHNQVHIQETDASDGADVAGDEDSVLELTDIASGEEYPRKDKELISTRTKYEVESQIKGFVDHLEKSNHSSKEESLDSTVTQLMRPLVKDWIDNNLPRIVERVVAEEIQKIIPKK